MKKTLTVILQIVFALILSSPLFGQTQKFDVMTFTIPTGWSVNEGAENSFQLSKTDPKKGDFCQVVLSKSLESKGSTKADFEYFWDVSIKKSFAINLPAELDMDESGELTSAQAASEIKYQEIKSLASVFTISGQTKFVGILVLTNNTDYLQEAINFISTVDFDLPTKKKINNPENLNTNGKCSEEKTSLLIEKANQNTNFDAKSKAINLVSPEYPKAARAVAAKGTVKVHILVDEKGDVVSAEAKEGHPLLFNAAEGAARLSKFNPMIIDGCKIRFDGTINYNFTN